MKHTPWTKEQAQKLASEIRDDAGLTRGTDSAINFEAGVLAGLAKAAEMIEARPVAYECPEYEIHGCPNYKLWEEARRKHDTHQANLVGVRPIEEDKK